MLDEEAVVFVLDTPQGTTYKRVVRVNSVKSGRIRGGSLILADPNKFAYPSWFNVQHLDKIIECHNLKKFKYKDKQDACRKLYKLLLPLAKEPSDSDFDPHHVAFHSNVVKKPSFRKPIQKKVVRVSSINMESKVKATDKVPSSDKNKTRQLYYTGELTVAELLEKHSDLKLGDIKYDVKSKFAEEV
jgi:hypothetical protein|tara:strand:+ start:7869 stop:8429 length:561 start_codon:yes stop_codon:yes gene_type:complete